MKLSENEERIEEVNQANNSSLVSDTNTNEELLNDAFDIW